MGAIQIDDRGIITVCPSCGQRNRVPFNATETRCGRCKAARSAGGRRTGRGPNAREFDALVRDVHLPVVVDFWAPWCGPCRMVAPELAWVAAANAGRYLVVKVNTDAVPELGERFRIRSIPTMAVFRGGKEIARTTGARPAAEIETFVHGAMAPRDSEL